MQPGLDFHRRACMRAWDNRERVDRAPHRRRLFGWHKSDPGDLKSVPLLPCIPIHSYTVHCKPAATQLGEEKYGRVNFFWDIPSTPAGDVTTLLNIADEAAARSTNAELFAAPKIHHSPGPVPAPPRRRLPPAPDVSDGAAGADRRRSRPLEEGRRALREADVLPAPLSEEVYNAQVELYNKEATRCFMDWQPTCPNWRPILLLFDLEQVFTILNIVLIRLIAD